MNDEKLFRELKKIRREIHQYPELGNQEFKTARVIERELKDLKIPHKRLTPTGIVALLKSKKSSRNSKCVALRADMDALPLTENMKRPYASKNRGVMHACGHDAHVAMLLGAAMILSERKDFPGTVKLFFQPNEEGAWGAKSLIKKGAMKNPEVDAIFGLHVNPRFPTGTAVIKEGPLMAAVDKFTLEILGQGGHAAYPHEGRDAICMASEIVQSLQTIVSRKIDPLEPAVLTVGTIQGGSRFNILAERVILTGTVRTLSEGVHRRMPELMRQIVSGICQAHGGRFHLNYERIGSVLSNDRGSVELSRRVALRLLGDKKVTRPQNASMGGQDFSEYLKEARGCFIHIGTGNPSLKTNVSWHHPEFDLDERALPVGAKLLAGIAQEFLLKASQRAGERSELKGEST